MDPDLLAEYAMRGASGKDTQWVDGPNIELTIKCNHKTCKISNAFYKDGHTHWVEDVIKLDPIKKIDIDGFISVAFFEFSIKAILNDGKEYILFKIEHAEEGKTYKTVTEIESGKNCELVVKIKKQ